VKYVKKLILFIIILTCICSACGTETNIAEEEHLSFIENYTFPPNEEELLMVMQKVNLNWRIGGLMSSFQSQKADNDTIAIHHISYHRNLIVCILNLNYSTGKYGDFSFWYKFSPMEDSITQEQYDRFRNEDLPLIWSLAGELLLEQDAIESLGEECMIYFNNYTKNGKDLNHINWWGRQNDIFCQVEFTWHSAFNQYMPHSMTFFDPVALAFDYKTQGKIKLYKNEEEVYTVSEVNILDSTPSGDFLISGYLENLCINDDDINPSEFYHGYPANVDLYQKGWLVDETGKLPVYIMPTPLSASELSKSRFHIVRIIDAPEPYCVIIQSEINYSINPDGTVLIGP